MFEGAEAMKQVGVYILAPFVGALLAGVLHSVMVWLEKPAVKKAVTSKVET